MAKTVPVEVTVCLNAAHLSAALQQISRKLWGMIDPGCNDDCCAPKRELARIADAALAAPPRNCDKFANDPDGAYKAFDIYVKRHNAACIKPSPLYTVYDTIKWMLAEAEGGSHA